MVAWRKTRRTVAQTQVAAQTNGAVSGGEHSLEISGVYRKFQTPAGAQVVALDNVNLMVDGAQIVSIVGPSGCGKSTLLRMIAGLDFPDAGEICFDGEVVCGTHYQRGMVFQDAALYDWLTVYGNIAFGLRARGILRKNTRKVDEYIQLMGLSGFEESYPYQISGGMASRVALARTFIQESGLVLLDEPLSALDAFTRATLQDEIVKMHQRTCATILMVTHDIEEAVYLSNRIVVMSPRPGHVVGEVSVDLSHPRDRLAPEFVEKRKEVLSFFRM